MAQLPLWYGIGNCLHLIISDVMIYYYGESLPSFVSNLYIEIKKVVMNAHTLVRYFLASGRTANQFGRTRKDHILLPVNFKANKSSNCQRFTIQVLSYFQSSRVLPRSPPLAALSRNIQRKPNTAAIKQSIHTKVYLLLRLYKG